MSTFIDYIRIKNNNNNDDDFLHPITKEKAVIDDNGVRLDYKIDDITQRYENVEKKIHLVQTAKGTPNEIILDNIELVDGFYTNFVILENNNGLTTINEKPLYKPNTTQPPTLIKGKAITIWYDATNDCFFIKDSDSNTELPDNLAYFSDEEYPTTPTVPRDSDLLGGEPRSYYEQLVQDIADKVTANLNDINTINNKFESVIDLGSSFIRDLHPNVSIQESTCGRRGGKIMFHLILTLTNISTTTALFKVSHSPIYRYLAYSLRGINSPYNIVNDASVWISANGVATLYTTTNLNGQYYLTGEFTANKDY